MSVLRRTLTLLTALPLVIGLSATAAQSSPASAPAPAPVVVTSPAPEPASAAGAAAAAADEWGGYSNGYIPASALCAIPWQTVDHLRCDAAAKLVALNAVYKAKWGANICVNDAYRSYAKQVLLYNTLGPKVAAVPGTSTHGWAIALDLGCGVGIFGHARHVWFTANAPKYGIAQPTWALQGSSRAEAWHWQYFGAYTAPTPPVPAATKMVTTAIIGITGTWPRISTVTIRDKATGKVLAGVPVTIKRRAVTTAAYTTVGTYKTNTAGKLAYTYYPNAPTVLVMSYAGSTTTLPSAAGVILTTPTVMSARVTAGRPNVLTGRLLTQGNTAVPSQTVHLQRRYSGSTTWTTVGPLRTGSTGYVTSSQQPRRGTYYRFYYPGVSSRYVSHVSPSVYVNY